MAQSSPAKQDTLDVLRVLPDENAFYFYKALGAPLGLKANSLIEFSSKLKEVDLTSIRFHTKRHDFENWVKMLGDSSLVEQIAPLSNQTLAPEELQSELSRIVEARLNSLRRSTSNPIWQRKSVRHKVRQHSRQPIT